jgi:hypothetical protein
MGTNLIELEPAICDDRTSHLAKLYSLYAPSAGGLAFLLTGDPDLAEDMGKRPLFA